MALAMLFKPASMSAQKYDECIRALQQAGQGAPRGRLYHLAYGDSSALQVLDVWDSQESFQAFGQVLMPILQRLGIDPGQPEISEVHAVIKG